MNKRVRIKISWHFLEVTHLLFLFEGGASSKMNSRCHLHYNLNCSSFEVGDNEADIKNRQGKNYHLLLLLIVIDWFHRVFSCTPHSSLVAPQSPIQVKSINLSTKTSSLIELRQLDTSICVDQFKFTTLDFWLLTIDYWLLTIGHIHILLLLLLLLLLNLDLNFDFDIAL